MVNKAFLIVPFIVGSPARSIPNCLLPGHQLDAWRWRSSGDETKPRSEVARV